MQVQTKVKKISLLYVFVVKEGIALQYLFNSITTLVSDKVHLFTGWRDIPKDKLKAFYFYIMKKLTYGFLDEVENWLSF